MLVRSIFQMQLRKELNEEKVMFLTEGSSGVLYSTLFFHGHL